MFEVFLKIIVIIIVLFIVIMPVYVLNIGSSNKKYYFKNIKFIMYYDTAQIVIDKTNIFYLSELPFVLRCKYNIILIYLMIKDERKTRKKVKSEIRKILK